MLLDVRDRIKKCFGEDFILNSRLYNFNCEEVRDLFDENLHRKYQLFIPLHKR